MVEILKEVTTALEPTRIYQILVRRVAQGLRIARCSVVLARPGDTEGTVVAAFENPTLRDLRVDLAKYPEIAEALRRGETVMVSDVDQHPLSRDLRASWALGVQPGGRTRSVIALPFALRGEPWGVFFLRTSEDDPPLNRIDLSFAEQVISAAVTALEKAYDLAEGQDAASLRALADTDPLTGLPNRRVLEQRLGEELDRARRYGQVLTVALVDLDHFKAINDEFGHQAGDAVLRQVATMLRRELRTNDLVARIGGEEFVLVLPETGAEGARLFVDRLLRRLSLHRFGPAEAPFWVTASVGLATFPDDRVADEEALLKLADENLYRAKHAGRNRYRD
jgi:diguanylate cyclase (GGDEF)-like protein